MARLERERASERARFRRARRLIRRRRRRFRLAITCLTIASRRKEDSGSGITQGRSLSYGRSRDRGEEGRLRFRRDRRRENRLELRKCARMTRRGGERGTGKTRRASGGIAIAGRLPKGARRKERERTGEGATATTTTTATATARTTTRKSCKSNAQTFACLPGGRETGRLYTVDERTTVTSALEGGVPSLLERDRVCEARRRQSLFLSFSPSPSLSIARAYARTLLSSVPPPPSSLGLPLTRCLSSGDVEEVDDACRSRRWG